MPSITSSYNVQSESCPREVLPSIVSDVVDMVYDPVANALAKEHGLDIQTVSWEDTARFKNSSLGPNISDMTLQVQDEGGRYRRMPVIRQPNFADKTHDVAIDRFHVWVGNESGVGLKQIPLREYLETLDLYLKNGSVKGSLFCKRDQEVVHSVQACFLPARDGAVNFNVALYNYQSYAENPAVLTIIASSHGTSAEVIDNGRDWSGQKLSFDKNGTACDFEAERLKDVRAKLGLKTEGALTEEELQDRKLQIIQIPLKVKKPEIEVGQTMFSCFEPKCEMMESACGIDDAQIRVGKETGQFEGLKGAVIERDERFPIRITTQIYKITDEGKVSRQQMDTIAAEIKKEESIGENGSSLVIEQTDRRTEWVKTEAVLKKWAAIEFEKDENKESILAYIDQILKDGILNGPKGYLAEWKNRRGPSEEYRIPEDPALRFFERLLLPPADFFVIFPNKV